MTQDAFLIRNVEIFDGLGKPPFRGDLVIRKDRIHTIAPPCSITVSDKNCQQIDGTNFSIAPGFIETETVFKKEKRN